MVHCSDLNGVNEDLIRERRQCTFSIEELTNFIDGSPELTAQRRAQEEHFLENLEKPSVPLEYLNQKEKYAAALQKAIALFKKFKPLMPYDKLQLDSSRRIVNGSLGLSLLSDGNPLALNYIMFIPALLNQGTKEQTSEWLHKAWNLNIIGTYAQTELGHGTFIRGLETTAIYDPRSQEFVLNSPTLSAYKWWPGGLGHTANYAVVMAQLMTGGEPRGIHPFVVQLRDEDTHMPLRGIKIGEIGAKMGFNLVNNGYLGFDNVRIPRMNMLMKYSRVEPDGTYVKAQKSVLIYSTMIFVRVGIVDDAVQLLKSAVVIAARYSAVRRQSELKQTKGENQILDYLTQQNKIFPQIATFFAYLHASQWLWEFYYRTNEEIEAGKFERLAELHATASCFKALSTMDTTEGIEVSRLSCGGHGYMISSGLPTIYSMSTAACTYEGENTVLLLQTARFLVKSYHGYRQGHGLPSILQYLGKHHDRMNKFERSSNWVLLALECISARKIELVCHKMELLVEKGQCFEDAWNFTSVELTELATIHCRTHIFKIYKDKLDGSHLLSKDLKLPLNQLLHLYAVTLVIKHSGDFLRFTSLTNDNMADVYDWLAMLLTHLRPNVIGITDAFDIRDEIINSTLGSYDGNVYERLFKEAAKSPLNQQPVDESFDKYLKPFMKSNI